MSFKKIILSGAAALTLIGSSAFAALELDGTGDYLVSPSTIAYADGTWFTNLKIVNTNTTHAIVARVVIRNGHNSEEIFDFPIYLTPSDAWEGTLKAGSSDEPEVYTGHSTEGFLIVHSEDDSSMVWKGETGDIVQANVDGGINYTSLAFAGFGTPTRKNPDNLSNEREKTYVEVFGLAAYDASDVPLKTGATPFAVGMPLDKLSFFEYARCVNEGTPKSDNVSANLYPTQHLYGLGTFLGNPDIAACVQANGANDAVTLEDVDNDSLFGKQVIRDLAGSKNMAINMSAVSDLSADFRWERVIGPDTTLARMTADKAIALTNILTSFAKDKIYVMNEGDATSGANTMRVQFTDPAKKYVIDEVDGLTNLNNVLLTGLYKYEDKYTSDAAVYYEEFYYEYYQDAHDMIEVIDECAALGDNNDVSNTELAEKDCYPTKVHYELYRDVAAKGTAATTDYFFPAGGFMTFNMIQKTAIIPTTLSSVKSGDDYVNYHIANQYKAATPLWTPAP